MYLKYGSYSHSAGEITLTAITRDAKTGNSGIVESITEQWVLDGRLQIADQGTAAANQAAMTTAISALKTAYSKNGYDLGFYDDAGNLTSHSIKNKDTVFGVRVAHFGFPVGAGAEYSTFRSYQIVIEADYLYGGNKLTSWQESISFVGTGGPTFGLLIPINGILQPQLLTQQSACYAVQNCRATQAGYYPIPGGPIWGAPPEHLEQRQISYSVAASGNNIRSVDWTYVFEAPGPLIGYPRYRTF